MPSYTSDEEFDRAYRTLNATFKSGKTKDLRWRKWQLKQIWWMVEDNEEKIIDALQKDLNRDRFESLATDIAGLKQDILDHIKNLEKWNADEPVEAGFIFGTLAKARIRHEPLGVALIIGAWNFPLILLLQPVVAAVAAGCAVVMKPSDLAIATQDLICEMVPKYLDTSAIAAVSAGPREMSRILEYKFEHIFYTGGSKVARFIAAAAAKHLTPTVLELGGQGPAIVTATANVDLAAKRIAYAKFLNAGQICISVNHVFADASIYDEFVKRLAYWNDHFQGGDQKSANMVRIVNERNFDRLAAYLERTKGEKSYGGELDKATLSIKPTIVINVQMDDALMEEELFGPICPVIKSDFQQAIEAVNSLPHPLAIYVFSSDQGEIDQILANTNSGGVCVNDVIVHIMAPNAPFGGVGESGSGYYHGMYGVRAFQHLRTIVAPPNWLERLLAFRYPPYGTGDGESKAKTVRVKNNLGFKPGEAMEDQKIGGGWFSWIAG